MGNRKSKPKVNAHDLYRLLADRHAEDVFVGECKTGSTWMQQVRIMDAWAMKRSWANPRIWAYEIKVSRSDFMQDEKWTDYLPYCNTYCRNRSMRVPTRNPLFEIRSELSQRLCVIWRNRLLTLPKWLYTDLWGENRNIPTLAALSAPSGE